MTGLDDPWISSGRPVVHLVRLSHAAIRALSAGDLSQANRLAPVELTPYLAEPSSASTWRRRSLQMDEDPTDGLWITRVIYDPERQIAVGKSGYHGPPDSTGMVEVGYDVDPLYRRQGYARAALVALLERARTEPSVRVVRATISPDNAASRALVAQFGLVDVGEQWDDEDGLETIFEVETEAAAPARSRRLSGRSPLRVTE